MSHLCTFSLSVSQLTVFSAVLGRNSVTRLLYVLLKGRKAFYLYCALMSTLDAVQTVGSGLIYFGSIHGMW